MKTLILIPVVLLCLVVPGDVTGFPHGAAHRAAPASHAAAVHTPAFVAPHVAARSFAPVHTSPIRPAVTARPALPLRTAQTPFRAPAVTARVAERAPERAVTSRAAVGNHFLAANRGTLASRGIYIHRPNGYYSPGYAHYHNWYANWHHGYWGSWYTRPWLWFGGGVAAGWLLAPGENVVYANPYYLAPSPTVVPVFNYSQPIPVAGPLAIGEDTSDLAGESPPLSDGTANATSAAVAQLVDQARQAFAAMNYAQAQQLVDQAIQQQPGDPTLHEFRALTLFAQAKYTEAAATIYDVLAVGPGWDWDTLKSFYADPATYTSQLRALEQYTRANPSDAAARFLLAYEYLTINAHDAAVRILQGVVALRPNDQLSKYLLQMLTNQGSDRPAPAT